MLLLKDFSVLYHLPSWSFQFVTCKISGFNGHKVHRDSKKAFLDSGKHPTGSSNTNPPMLIADQNRESISAMLLK